VRSKIKKVQERLSAYFMHEQGWHQQRSFLNNFRFWQGNEVASFNPKEAWVSEHHFSSVLPRHDTPGTVVDVWGPFLVSFSSLFLDFLLVKDPIFF
jgi:hypothetical protein